MNYMLNLTESTPSHMVSLNRTKVYLELFRELPQPKTSAMQMRTCMLEQVRKRNFHVSIFSRGKFSILDSPLLQQIGYILFRLIQKLVKIASNV